MALAPTQQLSTPYEDYAGFFLKFFAQGTTTPITMAINKSGSPTVAKAELSSGGTVPIGFIKTAGDVIFIPYVDEAYDAYLFPTEAEADANDTANAVQIADDVDFLQDFAGSVGVALSFDTVAAMVASTGLSVGNIIETAGYTAKGDGGDNRYEVVAAGTGTDDGGSFIDLDTLQAKALFPSDTYNANQWNAFGSGDDTTQAQAAVDYVLSIGGGDVVFTDGTYNLLSLQLKSNVNLVSEGAKLVKPSGIGGSSILEAQGTMGASTTLTADVTTRTNLLSVTSGTSFPNETWILVSSKLFRYATSGLIAEYAKITAGGGTTSLTLDRNLTFDYLTADGADITVTDFVENVTVSGFELDIPDGISGGGIFCDISRSINIVGNDIHGMKERAGIRFRKSLSCHAYGQNNIHDGQDLTVSASGYGIEFDEFSQYCTATNNSSANVREWLMTNNAAYCEMSNNTITSPRDSGLNTHGSGCWYCIIDGNTVTGSRGIGVAVGFGTDNAADVGTLVSNNHITFCDAEGIQVASNPSHGGNDLTVVRGNKVFFASQAIAFDEPAIRVSEQLAIFVYDNIIFSPEAAIGIWVLNDSADIEVYDNHIIDGGNYGVRVDDSADTIVRNNQVGAFNIAAFLEVTPVSKAIRVRNSFDNTSIDDVGSDSITLAAAITGSVAITFTTAFNNAPTIFPSHESATGVYTASATSITTTGFTLVIDEVNAAAQSETVNVGWFASGIS